MKDKIFGVLQRVGRSFMLPIAILPVSGLLLGIGSSFTNETVLRTYRLVNVMGKGTVLNAVLQVMSEAGDIVFANLPLLFAVGVAIGILKNTPKAASEHILKLLTKVAADAENNFSMDPEKLYVSECFVCPGMTLKRIMPRGKGSADRILKRTSHITVAVAEKE